MSLSTATQFRLIIPGEGQILHLQRVWVWGEQELSKANLEQFKRDKTTYGELISKHAKVTVSSPSEHDPPNGLEALVQDKDNGVNFAFHTQHEPKPWVQLAYDEPVTVHAISIRNRFELHERAEGLTLEVASEDGVWRELWKAPKAGPEWHVDLTHLPKAQRNAKHLRLIIYQEPAATLHLGQVRVWVAMPSKK